MPERVPFRLTQNLETALGLTGVEVMTSLLPVIISTVSLLSQVSEWAVMITNYFMFQFY